MNENERKIIEEIKKDLGKINKNLIALLDRKELGEELEDWMRDRVELWCRVFNEGGIVTQNRLHEIWGNEMKKSTRGLGGFFVGKGASLQWTADDKVVLTIAARDAIEDWTGTTIEEYAKKYKKRD